jgi:hypothetical protein
VLESLVDKYPTHVVLGDLNIDLLKDILNSRALLDNFESLSLKIVNDGELTHFQTGARPLFATNSLDDVGFFTQVDLPLCRTFHYLIYGSMKFPVFKTSEGLVYYYRDFSRIDFDCLLVEVSAYDWSPIYATPSVDEQVD